jgi:hypothetical protein
MSTYDDRDATMARDPLHAQQPMPPQYGYGYGYGMPYGRFGMGMRRGFSETKPFFLTSEFLGTLLCVAAVAITAAVAEDLDSRLATALISGLVAAYTISRGIAKAGTRSSASDPRDDIDLGRTRQHSGDGSQ